MKSLILVALLALAGCGHDVCQHSNAAGQCDSIIGGNDGKIYTLGVDGKWTTHNSVETVVAASAPAATVAVAADSNKGFKEYNIVCIDHVSYVFSTNNGSISVQYGTDSKVKECL